MWAASKARRSVASGTAVLEFTLESEEVEQRQFAIDAGDLAFESHRHKINIAPFHSDRSA